MIDIFKLKRISLGKVIILNPFFSLIASSGAIFKIAIKLIITTVKKSYHLIKQQDLIKVSLFKIDFIIWRD